MYDYQIFLLVILLKIILSFENHKSFEEVKYLFFLHISPCVVLVAKDRVVKDNRLYEREKIPHTGDRCG